MSEEEDCLKCNICFEFGKLIVSNCCNQRICQKCFDTWTIDNDTCPYCREKVVKDKWIRTKNNIGYKINVILDTCTKNGVNVIPIKIEEFDCIKQYLEDFTEDFKPTSVNNLCICSNDHRGYYGSFNTIIIQPKEKIFYHYYLCSSCSTLSPKKLWNKMVLFGTKYSDKHIPVSDVRDSLISYFRNHQNDYNVDVVEGILNRYIGNGFIKAEKYSFIQNLISICSNKDYLNSDIQYMLFKRIDIPTNDVFKGHLYLSKVFFNHAWTIANKYDGFIGLYPICSLWNIVRGDTKQYLNDNRDCFSTVSKILSEWKQDIE